MTRHKKGYHTGSCLAKIILFIREKTVRFMILKDMGAKERFIGYGDSKCHSKKKVVGKINIITLFEMGYTNACFQDLLF